MQVFDWIHNVPQCATPRRWDIKASGITLNIGLLTVDAKIGEKLGRVISEKDFLAFRVPLFFGGVGSSQLIVLVVVSE
jgi:hypothetical protein